VAEAIPLLRRGVEEAPQGEGRRQARLRGRGFERYLWWCHLRSAGLIRVVERHQQGRRAARFFLEGQIRQLSSGQTSERLASLDEPVLREYRWRSYSQPVLLSFSRAGSVEDDVGKARRFPKGQRASKGVGSNVLIGTANVLSGEFEAFSSRRDRINADMILASATIPTLFKAVRTDGGVYWDGLFSQNSPARELPDAKPNEILVI
jgi:predicted acylesterase/phospholipase RssA